VVNVVRGNGTLEYSYSYQPYGAFRSNRKNDSAIPTNFNRMSFNSEYKDTGTTNFFNLRARVYDPGTGSFLTADPISQYPDYMFASGNPAMFSDPTGLFSWRDALDWFNVHLNPGYMYLEKCWGSDGNESFGSWLGGCALASTFLATTAVGVGRLTRIGAAEPAAAGETQIAANQAAGNKARDAIAARYAGAEAEVGFQTKLGLRRIDVLTSEGLAIESKVGYTSLTSSIEMQIAKDQLLLQSGRISGLRWVFTASNVTGRVGPSGPLAAALEKARIPWSLGP
jgi:RHS repeat-associated protein